MPSTSVIRRALDFEGPRTGLVDPMDIIQDAPNRLGARPNTAIGGDTEQATAQNPPRPATEIRSGYRSHSTGTTFHRHGRAE